MGTVALLSGLVVPHASATSVGDLQAQAQGLEARINALGNQESQLSEQYDAAVLQLQQTRLGVARAQSQVAAADASANRARTVLVADAVEAYVNNGSDTLDGTGSAASVAGAQASLLRAEYEQTLATSQSDTEHRYELASAQANDARTQLSAQEAVVTANLATIRGDEKRVAAAAASLVQAEALVKGQIATLIAEQQAAARRAAQLAADRRLAAERAATAHAAAVHAAAVHAAAVHAAAVRAAAARAVAQRVAAERAAAARAAAATTTTLPVVTTTTVPPWDPPPVETPPQASESSVAAAAVSAAETRVGDPYVWGAVGPDTFDCSGLVMWAYAQAGVTLPHYSGSQYAVTTHIPMDDLEPGDLVFFANPGEHVAMYVGGGDVIQAPYTGADVQIVPLYPEFVLASQVT